ncbi:MAG: hypothetical protein K2J15_00930 [Muribaculaceae bacterium]|nr:hypothetical protein [Muribaculaceae bacterium]
MRAKDVLSPRRSQTPLLPMKSVDSEMPLLEVLPHLLEAPGRMLGVSKGGEDIGIIDEISLLDGLGEFIAERDDSSVLTVECLPSQYSASSLAHAVEDADVHLVDLISHPADDGMLRVTLRVRAEDPSAAIGSLERYGYRVIEGSGHGRNADAELLSERIASLQALMNV